MWKIYAHFANDIWRGNLLLASAPLLWLSQLLIAGQQRGGSREMFWLWFLNIIHSYKGNTEIMHIANKKKEGTLSGSMCVVFYQTCSLRKIVFWPSVSATSNYFWNSPWQWYTVVLCNSLPMKFYIFPLNPRLQTQFCQTLLSFHKLDIAQG